MKDFTFLTLATEEPWDTLLKCGIICNREKVKVSIMRDKETGNPSELCISTPLVINNLSQKKSQILIVKTIIKPFEEDNICEPNMAPTCVPNLKTMKTLGFEFTLSIQKIKRVKFLSLDLS